MPSIYYLSCRWSFAVLLHMEGAWLVLLVNNCLCVTSVFGTGPEGEAFILNSQQAIQKLEFSFPLSGCRFVAVPNCSVLCITLGTKPKLAAQWEIIPNKSPINSWWIHASSEKEEDELDWCTRWCFLHGHWRNQENPQAAVVLRSQASRQTPLQADYPAAHAGGAAPAAHERRAHHHRGLTRASPPVPTPVSMATALS